MGNNIYLPGESVVITDIGEQPLDRSDPGSTLVCVTRGSDGGSVGDWFYPDGSMVPRSNTIGSSTTNIFTRFGYTEHVHLGTVGTPTGPLGAYRCDVPDGMNGTITVSASINITSSPPGMWFV